MASWNPDGMIEAMKPKPSDNTKESFVEGAVDYTYDATRPYETDAVIEKNFNEVILTSQKKIEQLMSLYQFLQEDFCKLKLK